MDVTDPWVAAILAAPDDEVPRLAWAKRAGGERGELVRVQCALARRDLPREERRRARARERELLFLRQLEWSLAEGVPGGTFVRGFIDHASLSLDQLAREGGAIFARAPLLRGVSLTELSADVSRYAGPTEDEARDALAEKLSGALAALPPGRLRSLSGYPFVTVSGDWADSCTTLEYGDAFVALVAHAPSLTELEELQVYATLGRESLPRLARLTGLKRVRAAVSWGGAGTRELLGLLPKLSGVVLTSEPKLTGSELTALLAAPELGRLTELGLLHSLASDSDLELLAKTPALAGLERLDLGFSRVSAAGYAALAGARHLGNLRELGASALPDDASLAAIARAPFAPTLRALDLRFSTTLTEASATTVLTAFPALESLQIGQAPGLERRRRELEALIADVS